MSLTPGFRLGPYVIVSAIGSGGMGTVYRAQDTRLHRDVAIKVLSPNLMARPDAHAQLAREARAVAALHHRNVCTLYDFGAERGIDYLVMEYLEGERLDRELMTGPLPLAEVLQYSVEIADALDHAHRRGFVHRDLKPGNVMVTKAGAVLLDFGLAISPGGPVFGGAETSTVALETREMTEEGGLKGTLPYMAPELLERHEADARSDIFAFGALVYEMATGRRAFEGQSQASIVAAILTADPPPIKDLQPLAPAALNRIVQKCLAKDPDDRWQDAHDLKTALQWISELDASDLQAPKLAAGVKRRERLAWTAAGVLLITSLGAIVMAWRAAGRNPAASVTRFDVGAPENATLFAGGGVMALSPDGRRLALIASPSGGNNLVWIHWLDSGTARPLVATTGASQPFWSPDSRFVAFFAGKKLRTVDVSSGAVQTLAEDAEGSAGSWSRGGDILFKSDRSGAIERLSMNDGSSKAVVGVDSSRGEVGINWPQFLPDGRRFLYFVKSEKPDFTGVYVASLDGPDRTRVLGDESQAIYVAPGYLVFRREGAVVAQRFDPSSLTLAGEPALLAQNVRFNAPTRRGVFSVSDTGVLAYQTVGDSALTWFDRNGNALGTIGPPGHYEDPAISPDGKTIAVARLDRQAGTTDIWSIDGARGGTKQVTFDPSRDSAPVWSRPDGERLAFASLRSGKADLYVKSMAGDAGERPLFSSSGGAAIPVDWSRDGRLVIFAQVGVQRHFDLWALPVANDGKAFGIVETPAMEGYAQLSPDGRWLAYDSNETGASEVWVAPFPNPSARKWRVSSHGGTEPRWGRDGRELFFLTPDQRLMSVSVAAGADFKVDAQRILFETAGVGPRLGTIGWRQYDVAPDGERFLINVPARGSSSPITVVLNWPALLAR